MIGFRRRRTSDENEQEKPVSIALVVEDEAILRLGASDMLEEMGFTVSSAESGEAAMNLMESGRVDLLITDIHMPGGDVDGLALARTAAVRWPNLKIVVCSGRSGVGTADLPSNAIFVSKPYTVEDIEAAILS